MSLRPQQKGLGSPEYEAAGAYLGLTLRECEVMHWVTEGKRDREIATILGISRRTVEKHVGHILEKLGVETRSGAINELHKGAAGGRQLLNSSPLTSSNRPTPPEAVG